MTYNKEVNVYNSYHENSLIPTSYLRDYGNDNSLTETPLPKQNYTTYDLFTLKANLEPYLHKVLSDYDRWYTNFITIPTDRGMGVFLHILDKESDRGILLSAYKKNKISELINTVKQTVPSSYCLVFDPDTINLNSDNISRSWIKTIIPYLNIKSNFKYDNNNNPLGEKNIDMPIARLGYRIYANLEESPRFESHCIQLQQDILKKLYYLYDIGAVIIDTNICLYDVVVDWNLKPIHMILVSPKEIIGDWVMPSTNIKGVYIPDWYDSRLSPMSEFMNRIMFGDKTLKITVEEKLTAYHAIARGLNKKDIIFSFVRGMVIVNINNYIQTTTCLDIICHALANQPNTVLQLDPNERSGINIMDKANYLGFKDVEIYYLTPIGHMVSIGLLDDYSKNEAYKLLRE